MGRRTPLKRSQIIGVGALVAGLAVIITIGAITEDDEATPSAAGTPTTSSSAPASPSATASSAETPSPSPAGSERSEVLTAKNSDDLAELLVSTNPAEQAQAFAAAHAGDTITYDGVISAMNNHEGYATRFDILVSVGDDPETAIKGPNFQFRDVNLSYDLHLTGDDIPDALGIGDKLQVTAEVVEYDEVQDLLLLDPVETRIR